MRANRCRTYCLQTDYSTNKEIFKPVLKDCKNCEFLKKRMLDTELNKFIEEQKQKLLNEIKPAELYAASRNNELDSFVARDIKKK